MQAKVRDKEVCWLKYGVISITHVVDIGFCIFYISILLICD